MAHLTGRRKIAPPAATVADPENEHRHLYQTRVNDSCSAEINQRARAAGLRPGPWLRMFLYEHLGITPKKD